MNTSFNVRGEPIVCTPYDAYLCFMLTGLDAMAMWRFWIRKPEQPPLPGSEAEAPRPEAD